MPQKTICRKCGMVLYEGYELRAPEETIRQLNGVCPRCGNRLLFNPDDILLKIAEKR
jgi:RNase P subunit RPR2